MKRILAVIFSSLILCGDLAAQGPRESRTFQKNSGGWYLMNRDSFTYNQNGQVLKHFLFPGNAPYKGYMDYSYQNDSLKELAIYSLNEFNQAMLTVKETHSRGVSGRDSFTLTRTSFTGNLQDSERERFYYNSSGQRDSIVREVYDQDFFIWKKASRIHFQYSGTKISEETRSYWEPQGWALQNRDLYYYQGSVLSNIISQDYNVNKWDTISNYLYIYDSTGLLKENRGLLYSYSKHKFEDRLSDFYTYNSFNQLKVNLEQTIEFGDSVMRDHELVLYYYGSEPVVAVTKAETARFSIYPNPASEKLCVNNLPAGALIYVYDLSGRLLISQLANGNPVTEIDIHTLDKALYFLLVNEQRRVLSEKFIKE